MNFVAGVPDSLSNSARGVVPPGQLAVASAGCGLFTGVFRSSVARVGLVHRGAVGRGHDRLCRWSAAQLLEHRSLVGVVAARGQRLVDEQPQLGGLGQGRVTGVDAGDRLPLNVPPWEARKNVLLPTPELVCTPSVVGVAAAGLLDVERAGVGSGSP